MFSVSAIPEQLQGQMTVLRYFASYMEQHLMKVSAGAQAGHWAMASPHHLGGLDSLLAAVARWTHRVVPGDSTEGVPSFGAVCAGGSAPVCGTSGSCRPFSQREVTCPASMTSGTQPCFSCSG